MNFLILAAAGSGTRLESQVPKQFHELEGKPLYQHSLWMLDSLCAEAIVVVPGAWLARVGSEVSRLSWADRVRVIEGGRTRQDSVWHGLQQLPGEHGWVLVHDAARPFASAPLVDRVLQGARSCGACVPGIPVSETVKEVEGTWVRRTLDRSRLRIVQTPQGFQLGLLKKAFAEAMKEGFQGNDEASLVERIGNSVQVVEGEIGNLKITWPQDLAVSRRRSSE